MKITKELFADAFVRSGQITGTAFLFYNFMSILLVGQCLWVEPNLFILIFEIGLSVFWFIGSLFKTAQTFHKRGEEV